MDAVVVAGGQVSGDDPLHLQSPDGRRCLIDIHGRPMIQWVVDALSASDAVDEIIVVGVPLDYRLEAQKRLHFLPDAGDIFANIRSGVCYSAERRPGHVKCLLASADIPAIKSDMVDWLAACVADNPDPILYYSVIPQQTMEAKFPKAHRSFIRFKDIAVCGGDMNVIDSRFFDEEQAVWVKLAETRKHPLRQASLLGFDALILVALHLITLEKAVSMVCKRLYLEGQALVSPYAEIGMDADKPHQLEILRKYLECRP